METPQSRSSPRAKEVPASARDLGALKHDQRDFVRILILDPWFRLVLVLVLLGFLTAVVSLPKFWRTTPAGFRPPVRVSLLNLAQAWQLRSAARAKEAEGSLAEAADRWLAAFRKNAGDMDSARQAIRSALALPEVTPKAIQRMATVPAWLLSLSGTNSQDVLLVARFYDKAGFSEAVYNLIEPLKDRLSPEEEVAYLKTLVQRGAAKEYASRWKRVESELAKDPEFALYHAAYLAVWGPVEGREAARQQLANAVEDPARRIVASRLQLLHFASSGDLAGYALALDRLAQVRQDRLTDRVGYWRLLVAAGRNAEARELAENEAAVPQNPRDVLVLAEFCQAIGMTEQAGRLLRQATLKYGGSGIPGTDLLWLARANVLIRTEDWRGIIEMVEQVRAFPAALEILGGWVDAVEGQARHGLDHRDLAKAAFEDAARKGFPRPALAFEVGAEMRRLGYYQPALDVLLPLETAFATNVFYWQTLHQLADALKQDAVLLLRSAAEVRRLKPDDSAAAFNYAAALLTSRQNPGEAVVLTRQALDQMRASPEARVNHCLALALNHRYEEASALLATVDPNRFDPSGNTVYSFAAFSVHLGLKQYDLARLDLDRIRSEHLFPNEVLWLEQMRREYLEPAAGSPTSLDTSSGT